MMNPYAMQDRLQAEREAEGDAYYAWCEREGLDPDDDATSDAYDAAMEDAAEAYAEARAEARRDDW